MTDADELLRLRGKQHDLEKQVWAAVELGKGNTRWLRRIDKRLADAVKRLDEMTEADKIADAITKSRRDYWTRGKRVLAALATGLLLVPAVHDLAAWLIT